MGMVDNIVEVLRKINKDKLTDCQLEIWLESLSEALASGDLDMIAECLVFYKECRFGIDFNRSKCYKQSLSLIRNYIQTLGEV